MKRDSLSPLLPAERWKSSLPLLLLLAITFISYASCFTHHFLVTWDDNVYVTANDTVRGITGKHIATAFSSFFVGNYAPLHLISYMVDYSLWGMNPGGFIFSNVLLHAVNGILLYLLFLTLVQKRFPAFLAALFFVCHPVQVESVAWISQRKNVLSMTFFLASFCLYGRYVTAGGTARRATYILSTVAFACALLTKSVTLILPVALVLYDLCLTDRKRWKPILVDKIPFAVLAAGAALLTLVSQSSQLGGGRTEYPENPLSVLFTMLPIFVRYLATVFWPTDLSAFYQVPVRDHVDAAVLLSALLFLFLGGGMVLLYRRQRQLFFGIAFFFLGLAPVSQVVPFATLINDRYLYFPLVGAALALGVTVSLVVERFDRPAGRTVTLLVLCALLTLPVLSYRRTLAWQNDVTLWTDATAKDPKNHLAWTELGSAYHKAGDLGSALVFYRRALSLAPLDFTALKNIALTHLKRGEYPEARDYLSRLVEHYPKYTRAYEDIGFSYKISGNFPEAEKAYVRALAIDPRLATSLMPLAEIYLGQGKLADARETLVRLRGIGGGTAEVEYGLGCIEAQEGHFPEAVGHLREALRLGLDRSLPLSEPLLAPLRTYPEFRTLLSEP